ncbi:MAG: hypothetical protein LBI28_12105 [Treponema sp.]|jgi:hypothetical protein|nr:hypothetical protein [Treponema sp.]
MKKTFLGWLTVFCILNLSTCFSPWEGDRGEGSLTISIGGSARSSFYDLEDVDNFSHTVSLRNANGTPVRNQPFSGSVTISVPSGAYTVTVKGSKEETLCSYGAEPVEVIPGRNTSVDIEMYSALELTKENWSELSSENFGDNLGRKLYVFLNKEITIDGQSNPVTLDNNVDVTLITEAKVPVGIKWNNTGSMFEINDGAILRLGMEGMSENITLKGNENNNTPLINIGNGGTLVMDGVTISDNTNDGDGGGVYVDGGTFNMQSGTISGNNANFGGGVYVSGASAIFTMNGGTISNNTAVDGGGVSVNNGGTFHIINGTIHGDLGDDSNKATVGAALYILNGTAQRGTDSGITWTRFDDLNTTNNTMRVVSGMMAKTSMPKEFDVASTAQWNSVLSYIGFCGIDDDVFIINVTNNFYVNGSTNNTFGSASGIEVTLQGVGMTLTLSDSGNILRIGNGQTVKLEGLALKGQGNETTNNTSLVYVDGGTLEMNGGVISDNTAFGGSGGGVCVVDSGIFTMNGGVISGNKAITSVPGSYSNGGGGGGVYVENYGIFTMNGGVISGNKANGNNGGGVGVGENGTFNMMKKDGEIGEISNNTADGNSGGGVGVYRGTFTMEDGNIYSNKAIDGQGGGVVLYGGTFTMECGNIYSNEATRPGGGAVGDGGGVYVKKEGEVNGTFTMNGGVISGNNAARFCGGVCLDNATFRISAGTIYGSENAVDETLRNTSNNGGAALHFFIFFSAQRGTFDGEKWESKNSLAAGNNTIKVENGNIVQ